MKIYIEGLEGRNKENGNKIQSLPLFRIGTRGEEKCLSCTPSSDFRPKRWNPRNMCLQGRAATCVRKVGAKSFPNKLRHGPGGGLNTQPVIIF